MPREIKGTALKDKVAESSLLLVPMCRSVCRSWDPFWPWRLERSLWWTAARRGSCCASTSTSATRPCPASSPPWMSATRWARCAFCPPHQITQTCICLHGVISRRQDPEPATSMCNVPEGAAYHDLCTECLRHQRHSCRACARDWVLTVMMLDAEANEPHKDNTEATNH